MFFTWFKSKGASAEVLGELNEIKQAAKPAKPEQSVRDPWRALQSSRDKLGAVEKQISTANENVTKYKAYFDEAVEWQEELDGRRKALVDEIQELQAVALEGKTTSERENARRLSQYDSLIADIQNIVAKGLPADNSDDRHALYNLIFHGQRERPQGQTESQNEVRGPTVGDPTEDLVDRSGFGFGPSKGARGDQTPYSNTGKGFAAPPKGAGGESTPPAPGTKA